MRYPKKENTERVSVKRAADLTGLSELTIREGIKSGRLPFGLAVPSKSGTHNTIHISPGKLSEYLGISIDQVKGGQH